MLVWIPWLWLGCSVSTAPLGDVWGPVTETSGPTVGPSDPSTEDTSTPGTDGTDTGETGDASTSDTGTLATTTDPDATDLPYVPDDPATLPKGLAWIRTERPFVSGLTVNLGAPPAAEVDRYYGDFHATATHLWSTGVPDEVAGWEAAQHPDFRWVSWTDKDGVNPITGVGVGDVPVAAGRIGYQIFDEPRTLAEVDEMQVGVDRVRSLDPDALVLFNFGNPDDGLSPRTLFEYAIVASDPDVIAYDYYSDDHGEYERAGLVRDLGLQYDKPYWRYIDSYGDHTRPEPDLEDLRWSALLGLVYGYSGHTWFLYQTDAPTAEVVYTTLFDTTGEWSQSPNPQFDAVAELNQELESYADTINMLTSTAVTYEPMSVLYMPNDHVPFRPGTGGDPYMVSAVSQNLSGIATQEWSMGFFVDDHDETYVMVLNANHPSASFPLYRPSGDLRLTLDFGSAPPSVDRTVVERFDPDTGSVVPEPLTWLGGTEAALDVTLDAGDVLLFKYATGAPFARRP